MERRRSAAVAIGVIVITSATGFVAGSRITSPAEVASRTASPQPSLILVPVEERVLATEVVTRGTGRFGSPQKLSVPASALKPTPGLVAELPLPSAELVEGDAVASASGRPLFLLAGARPMSRDLGPGLSGDDVRQLEEALSRLGFDPGPPDGVYDDLTAAGVEAWYLAAGYSSFNATAEQLAAVRAREADLAVASFDVTAAIDAVTSADAALTTAQAAAAAATRRVGSSSRAVDRARKQAATADVLAQQELSAKQSIVAQLKAGRPVAPATSAQVRAAEADLVAARTSAQSVATAGQRTVADAQAALDQAPARLDAARSAATAADVAAAAEVAAKQAAHDELLADPSATPAQLAAANADLATARNNADTTRAAGLQTVTDAQVLLATAPKTLEQARSDAAVADDLARADIAAKELALSDLTNPTPPTSSEIAAGELDVTIAVANRDTVRVTGEGSVDDAIVVSADAAADAATNAAAVVAAEDTLANARAALSSRSDMEALAAGEADLVNRRAGVQVPADEVVFVASAPVRVAELLVVIGDPASGSMITVTDSVVNVDSGLALADAALVKVGMAVRLDEPALGIAADGVVAFVAAGPGTNGVDGFHVYVSVDVAQPPPNLVGASVRLTIPVESSGKSVLAVPVSALTLAADGSSQVQRSIGGVTEFVSVRPGLSAAGYVGITATGQSLAVGDLVVIGVDQPVVPSASPTDSLPPGLGGSVPTESIAAPTDSTAVPASGPTVTNGSSGVSGG